MTAQTKQESVQQNSEKLGGDPLEVRINKEVRNYQESLFFGLSPAAVAVRTAGGRRGSGRIFRPAPCAGEWGDRLGLRACSLPFALGGFFSITA